jgi:hypothetical protein
MSAQTRSLFHRGCTLALPLSALLTCSALGPHALLSTAQAQINISVNIAPPPLPVYVQPALPGPDYIWVPGYWDWDPVFADYYWVPGYWIEPPQPRLYWTPGYWGWNDGVYVFHRGYWGPSIGFYGGVNYGYGYTGDGFYGGRWDGDHFSYNRSVTNITNVTNINITKIYNQPVSAPANHTSLNGGAGGVQAHPTPQQIAAQNAVHIPPTALQQQHQHVAASNPQARLSANGGKPSIAAVSKAGDFAAHPIPADVKANPPAVVAPHAEPPLVQQPPKPPAALTSSAKPQIKQQVKPQQPQENNKRVLVLRRIHKCVNKCVNNHANNHVPRRIRHHAPQRIQTKIKNMNRAHKCAK